MHGSLNEELRFLQSSLEGLARALAVTNPDDVSAQRTKSSQLLNSSGLSLLGGPIDSGGASSTMQMSVITETIGSACASADFLGTSLLAPHLLMCANLTSHDHPMTASSQRLAVGFNLNLLSLAHGTTATMAVVDIGTGAHTALHLDVNGEYLLASAIPAGTPSVGEDPGRRIVMFPTDNSVPIGEMSPIGLERWKRYAFIAIASELMGLMQGAFNMTVAYAKTRSQFGRPIGSFQSIQHMLADCHSRIEAVRSIVRSAAADEDLRGSRLHLARAAKITASESSLFVIETCIQIHGGIGHTWEYPLHLYLRRAMFDRQLLGNEMTLINEVARDLLTESEQQ